MGNSIRAFFAAPLSGAMARAVARVAREAGETKARITPVGADGAHITMAFLGDIPLVQAGAAAGAARSALRGARAFNVHVNGVGAFPDTKRPRVLWAGIREGADELADLQQRLAAAVGERGQRRRFMPHVTFARVKGDGERLAKFLETHTRHSLGRCRVESVVLYQSLLSKGGARYVALETITLGR